jgi:hypothetical protein
MRKKRKVLKKALKTRHSGILTAVVVTAVLGIVGLIFISRITFVASTEDGTTLGATSLVARQGNDDFSGNVSSENENDEVFPREEPNAEGGTISPSLTPEHRDGQEGRFLQQPPARLTSSPSNTLSPPPEHMRLPNHEAPPPVLLPSGTKKPEIQDRVQTKPSEDEQENDVFGRIKISTEDGHMVLHQNRFKVDSQLPISVDPETHALTVTTPSGVKTVTILPAQAVDHILAAHELTEVTQKEASSSIALQNKDGEAVYHLTGTKDKKMFGLFPVKVHKNVTVSAESGDIVSSTTSLVDSLVDLISF